MKNSPQIGLTLALKESCAGFVNTFVHTLDSRSENVYTFVMTKMQKSFRFDAADVNRWQSCANLSCLSLSEWIRRRCNDLSIADIRAAVVDDLARPAVSTGFKYIESFEHVEPIAEPERPTALSLDDIRKSIEARKAAPVDMSKILP